MHLPQLYTCLLLYKLCHWHCSSALSGADETTTFFCCKLNAFCVFLLIFQDNVYEWLDDLCLLQYWPNFEANLYIEPEDLEDLTSLANKEALGELLNIRKPAHLNRLWMGVSKLQYVEQGKIHHRN